MCIDVREMFKTKQNSTDEEKGFGLAGFSINQGPNWKCASEPEIDLRTNPLRIAKKREHYKT